MDKDDWISVEDELPKDGQRVKVAYIPKGIYFHYFRSGWSQEYSETLSGHMDPPSHWQPMSEPPNDNPTRRCDEPIRMDFS